MYDGGGDARITGLFTVLDKWNKFEIDHTLGSANWTFTLTNSNNGGNPQVASLTSAGGNGTLASVELVSWDSAGPDILWDDAGPIPEPATMSLLAIGGVSALLMRRRRA